MLLQAMEDFGIRPDLSFMIGDKGSDIQAGRLAGVAATVLVQSPKTEAMLTDHNRPTYLASNLYEAARVVLSHWSQMQSSEGPSSHVAPTDSGVGSHA
jgi:histidinol phosphatase-like enzyme